jgi:hypothetical protein
MSQATTAAQKSADAAVKQLEVSERPWIQLDLSLSEPLIFNKDGLQAVLKIVMNNTGHSAGASVLMASEMHARAGWPTMEMIQAREKLCNQVKESVTKPYSGAIEVLFPGTYPVVTFAHMAVPKADVENVTKLSGVDQILPLIFTCVVYRSTFNDTFHESAYTSFVGFVDPQRKNALLGPITIARNMKINPEQLVLQNEFHGD